MIDFLLWFLATIDAAFIGYRDAAGRNALIDKRKYYLKALLRGAILGQIAVLIAGSAILISFFLSNQPWILIDDLRRTGARALTVYLSYALVIFIAFAIRLYPSVDIKSITSTVIFGPFTLLRPIVAVGGMIYGLAAATAPQLAVFLICSIILTMMLGLEWFLQKLRKNNLSVH